MSRRPGTNAAIVLNLCLAVRHASPAAGTGQGPQAGSGRAMSAAMMTLLHPESSMVVASFNMVWGLALHSISAERIQEEALTQTSINA